jgi:PTS system ascorbate-specific IIA component
MLGFLIIAHAPLASALKAIAEHAFPGCAISLVALDVSNELPPEQTEAVGHALLAAMSSEDVLILTDVFGATPCNLAQKLASDCDSKTVKIVAGVNVPMLWRSLCYAHEGLDSVVERAVSGAAQGVIQVCVSRPQNQTTLSGAHDSSQRHHQQ